MSHFLERQDIYNQTIRLSDEQKVNPLQVLERFTSDYKLSELRHFLWIVLETCLTSDNFEFDDPDHRAMLFSKYERIEEVMEAVFILAKAKAQKIG